MMTMMAMAAGILLAILLVMCTAMRVFASISGRQEPNTKYEEFSTGISQTAGSREIQADIVQVYRNDAGIMAVMADGMGKDNTGRISAQIAADALLDAFEPYRVLHKPEYFFKTAFMEANKQIQKTIGERRGGACMAAVYTDGVSMHYGLAGDIRIAVMRHGELIPVSQGQTIDMLAYQAYKEGKISKRKAIWSMEEKKAWNYLGMDGFKEIEICRQPIQLKYGDIIAMVSRGIYEEFSWAELEDILLLKAGLKEKADGIVAKVEKKNSTDRDNGSVLLLKAEVADEKNQF